MADDRQALRREPAPAREARSASGSCPLCDGPAAVKEVRGPGGPDYRLLVLCDACTIYHLTTSAEYVLRRRPNGRSVLADRARRSFASTGLPIEIDVETVERVAQFFRD